MFSEKVVMQFLDDCTCRDCGAIQPYIWENTKPLCKRCYRKKFGKAWEATK